MIQMNFQDLYFKYFPRGNEQCASLGWAFQKRLSQVFCNTVYANYRYKAVRRVTKALQESQDDKIFKFNFGQLIGQHLIVYPRFTTLSSDHLTAVQNVKITNVLESKCKQRTANKMKRMREDRDMTNLLVLVSYKSYYILIGNCLYLSIYQIMHIYLLRLYINLFISISPLISLSFSLSLSISLTFFLYFSS